MPQNDTQKKYSHIDRKDIVWALFLIFIGAIFLLNTTGVLGWDIWIYILRFWPIFIILAGIKLMAGDSIVAEIVLSVVSLIVFLSIGLLSYMLYTGRQLSFVPGFINKCVAGECNNYIFTSGGTTEQNFVVKADEYSGVTSRVLDLKIGAATFNVEDEDSSNFVNIDTRYSKGFYDPSLKSTLNNGVLNMKFDTIARPRVNFITFNNTADFSFKVGQPALDTNLNLDLGAGEGTVALKNVKLVDVDANVGAGKLSLDLSNDSIPTGELKLEVGAGEIELQLPKEVGYEITYSLGIGEISVNGDSIAEFAGKGSNVRSSNYDSASKKVKIDANVGVGSLEIKTN